MDSEVVLNAIFDTYKENQIARDKFIENEVTKPPICKLFQYDQELFDISGLTINMSRSLTPVYHIGGNPADYIPGRTTITGEFKVNLTDIKHAFSPEFDYHIECDVTYKSGSVMHMKINNVVFHDSLISDTDVVYQYEAVSMVNQEDVIRGY